MRQHHSSTVDVFVVHLVLCVRCFCFLLLRKGLSERSQFQLRTTLQQEVLLSLCCSDSLKKTTGNGSMKCASPTASSSSLLCVTTVFVSFSVPKGSGEKKNVCAKKSHSQEICVQAVVYRFLLSFCFTRYKSGCSDSGAKLHVVS